MEKEERILQIIELQRQMNRIIRERTLDTWVNLSLTIPQLKCLFYVARHRKVNLSAIASGLHVTPGNITGIIDRLVVQGLMKRTSDREDRRVLWVELTENGEVLLSNLREGRAGEMHKILESLTPDELSTIVHAFTLLVKSAEDIRKED